MISDLRFAFRQLLKRPGFTITAVTSLALGIGATTAVFSVIYATLIDPYPYPNVDRIVRLSTVNKAGKMVQIMLTPPEILEARQASPIASVLALDFRSMIVTGQEFPRMST